MGRSSERQDNPAADSTARAIAIDWRFLLPAQALMVITWVAALRIYGDHDALAYVCLGATVVLSVIAVSPRPPLSRCGTLASPILAVTYAALAWAVGWPAATPLLFFAASECACACMPGLPFARRLAASLRMMAVSALFQWIAAAALQYVLLRARQWSAASELAAQALDWLGLSAASVTGVLYVNTSTELLRITPSAEKLGLIYVGLFIAGLGPWFVLAKLRPSFYACLAAATIAFIVWRYVMLVCTYIQTQLVDCFWDPVCNGACLVILSLMIYAILPQNVMSWSWLRWQPRASKGSVCATALFAGIAAAMVCAICFEDPGIRKEGRVVVDESHSDWEWTEQAFDTNWYGDRAGYNYATMFDHLNKYYKMTRNETGAINARLLRDCDVLILKTPTRAYSDEEVEAIVRFVRRGGGLYLIGDHTNVFGMTTYLNGVANRFGFSFGYDATYDLATGTLQKYMPPQRLRDPTIVHMPSKFLFGTSCSLHPGVKSRVSICGYGIRGLHLDYSRKGFFPEGHLEGSMDFGWIAQGLSQSVGRGRVAAFTDSTIFSNFWYFIPGKSELFLGTVEWLNRSNSDFSRMARWTPLALLIVAALYYRKRALIAFPIAALPPAVVAGFAAMLASDCANQVSYALPKPRSAITTVAFDRKYSDLNIPAYDLPGGARSFHTFYTWIQRLGCVPKAIDDPFSQLEDLSTLIMIYPRAVPSKRDRARLRRWLEAGGTLLVLDGFDNPTPLMNEWLADFGLRFDYGSGVVGELEDLSDRRWAVASAVKLIGGTPFLFARVSQMARPPLAADGDLVVKEPAAAMAQIGRGRVLAIGLADSFQDARMGTTKTVPNDMQRSLYELEYALLRAVANLPDGDRLPIP